jgi:hypothetical protein
VLDPANFISDHNGIVIINDLSKSEHHSNRSYVKDGPLRFVGNPAI